MRAYLRVGLLLLLVTGTLTQEFDLANFFDDPVTTAPPKSKEPPKDTKPKSGGGDLGFDLGDAVDHVTTAPPKPKEPPKDTKPKSGGGDFGFDLGDAVDHDNPKPKPDPKPENPSGGGGKGGGSFDDSDLFDIGGGGYQPDPGKGGRSSNPGQDPYGGRSNDPGYDPHGGADQPQEAGSGKIAGIISAVAGALLGAASTYFAYQKKKLCFKLQGGADPERGQGQYHQNGQQSDPQVFSNLLRTS